MLLAYQRWLECDLPDGIPPATAPTWSWPLPLSDGRTLLTLLYHPLHASTEGHFSPRTIILELSNTGGALPWPPGIGYSAPILFHATPTDDLIGLDLTSPAKLYACRPDGTHLWTLETRLCMANLLAPAFYEQRNNQLLWQHADGQYFQADLSTGSPENIQPIPTPRPLPPKEIHHPHTHLIGNSLYILDSNPMPRITRYKLTP